MAVSLREYRARIKSTESMKKITRAMELIAASRIIKAQQRAQAAAPYARELTRAVSAVATYSNVDHPLTTEEENPTRAAVLIVTSDRGLAGAYSSSVLKEAERLARAAPRRGQGDRHLHRRPQGRGVLQVPPAPGRAVVDRLLRPAVVRRGRRDRPDPDRRVRQGAGRGGRRRRGARRLHAVPVDADPGAHRDPAAAARGRRGRGAARATAEVLPLYEFEPSRGGRARRAAAAVRPEPDLLRAAAGGGLRARGPPEGDEVGDRQRRRAHQEVHPGRQPGPPGRDHPGDQRDRRWRQRARRRPGRASEGREDHDCNGRRDQGDRRPAATGRVARVIGPVVDIEFPVDSMPEIYNTLETDLELGGETPGPLARGRPAHRRRHGPRHLAAADRRPGPRRPGARHRRARSRCRSATSPRATSST